MKTINIREIFFSLPRNFEIYDGPLRYETWRRLRLAIGLNVIRLWK